MLRVYARAYRCGPGLVPEEVKRRVTASPGGDLVQTAGGTTASNELFVEMLAAQTLRALRTGSLLARRPEMDFLLRLAGTTQISKAIRLSGSNAGRPFLLVVAGSKKPKAVSELAGTELPRRELSKAELERVEAAALLGVQRA